MRADHSEALDPERLRGLPILEALQVPIDPGCAPRTAIERVFSWEARAYGALTFGDLLYDWMRIEPHVLEAIDFVRVGDLADIFTFARHADGIQALSHASHFGNVTQLQGYVAERVAAGMLRAQGAEVEIPASASQPGYDLIVNGQPCQIKCLDDPSGVYTHLGRYPDIPVLVNEELAPQFAENGRVMALPGLNHDQVRESTESSLGAGADLLDFEIPLISSALQAGRNAIALARKHTDWRAAAEKLRHRQPGAHRWGQGRRRQCGGKCRAHWSNGRLAHDRGAHPRRDRWLRWCRARRGQKQDASVLPPGNRRAGRCSTCVSRGGHQGAPYHDRAS